MTRVFLLLVWFQQVRGFVSQYQHFSVVCVDFTKYWLSLAVISVLVPWPDVLAGNEKGNDKPQRMGQYPWGSVSPYLVLLATFIAGEC